MESAAGRRMSGIVLAGGRSRRMGCNKAELELGGQPLVLRQLDKLRALEIEDLLLSGAGYPSMPGVRQIPDVFPDRGPLGGIHACLLAARHPLCLVLSVDVPLVPVAALAQLCEAPDCEVTVLRHSGGAEPLIGRYHRDLAERIAGLIAERGAPVWALREAASWQEWEYRGPEELFLNCNAPEDYRRARALLGGAARETAERGGQNHGRERQHE